MPEAIPQFDAFSNSMIMGETNLNFFSLEHMSGQPAQNEDSLDQNHQSQSKICQNRTDALRTIGDRNESWINDTPSDVVDEL